MTVVRRVVPNDNSCLFYALAYLSEGASASPAVEQRLRGLAAEAVLKDPDPETRALFLGKPVTEYAEWIMDTFHWGGENEIITLAAHYGVEVAVVSCETMSILCYGQDPAASARIYILYTGQHYDPLVGACDTSTPVEEEAKKFGVGGSPEVDAAALEIARQHNEEAAKRAKQKRVKRIKCGGCGALLADSAAFQEHCGEVEHDDDFCYDCEEVEVVIEADEALPEGSIDLTDEAKYFTFFNSAMSEFSNFYPAAVTAPDGVVYPSGEHWWQCAKYLETAPELAVKIQAASTVDEAHVLSHTEGHDRHRPDWDDAKYEILRSILRAKFAQHAALATALMATEGREIVNVDSDVWAGMQAPGGIATGNNHVGKALMTVRAELLGSN